MSVKLSETESDSDFSPTKQEPIEHKKESKYSPYMKRPLTSKRAEKLMISRPKTAKATQSDFKVKTKAKDLELLHRIKPRTVNMDKERLFEENLSLKQQSNNLVRELTRFKTKYAQLQKELKKRDDGSGSGFLLSKMKISLKDMRLELIKKENEIDEIKKKTKYTKTNELEIQVNTYLDECTRLRHRLEEVMAKHVPAVSSVGSFGSKNQDEIQALNQKLKEKVEENQEVKNQLTELELRLRVLGEKNEQIKNSHKKIIRVQSSHKSLNEDEEEKNNEYKELVSKMKAELEAKNRDYENLIEKSQNEIVNMRRELEGAKKEMHRDIESKNNEIEKLTKELRKTNDSKRGESEKLVEILRKEIEIKDEEFENIVKGLQQEIEMKDKECENVKEKNKKLEMEKSENKLKQKIEIKSEPGEDLINILKEELESKNREWENLSNILKNQLDSKEQECEHLKNLVNAKDDEKMLKEIVKKMKSEYKKKSKEFEFLEKKLEDAEIKAKEFELLQKRLEEAENNVKKPELLQEKIEESEIKTKEFKILQKKLEEAESKAKEFEILQIKLEEAGNKAKEFEELEKKLEEKEEKDKEFEIFQIKLEEAEIKAKKLEELEKKLQENEIKAKEFEIIQIKLEEAEKKSKEFEALEKKLKEYENKAKELQTTVEQQSRAFDDLKNSNKKKTSPPKFFRILNSILSRDNLKLNSLLDFIFTKDPLTPDDLLTKLKELHKNIKKSTISEVFGILKLKQNSISRSRIEEFFPEFKYETEAEISESDADQQDHPSESPKNSQILKTKSSKRIIYQELTDSDHLDSIKNIEIDPLIEIQSKQREIQNIDPLIEIQKKEPEIQNNLKEDSSEVPQKDSSEENLSEDSELNPLVTIEETQTQVSPVSQIFPKASAVLTSSLTKKNSLVSVTDELFRHFILKLQLNSIPKSSIFNHLFPTLTETQEITEDDLEQRLQSSPFNFSYSESKGLSSCLFTQPSMPISALQEKLNHATEDWEILTAQKKLDLEKNLKKILTKNLQILQEHCVQIDEQSTQKVSIQDFKDTLQKLAINFPDQIFNYFLLLCYDHEKKLDEVPYVAILQRWIEIDEESKEQSNEETRKIARYYLGIIAKVLIQNKKRARDVFMTNGKGMISPKEFLEGLEKLGLGRIELEYKIALLDALHFEGSEEHFISLGELEGILGFYGVKVEYEVEKTEGNVESPSKISELDSVDFEYGTEIRSMNMERYQDLE